MTEQQLTQARADLALLDIEQLRCGVMLQLLKIEALTKERDELQKQVDDFCMAYRMKTDVENKKLTQERDEQRHAADHWMTEATRDHNALQKLAAAHKVERDALRLELNEESQRLVSFILGDHAKVCTERDAALEQNTTLDARCAKLEAAGKLAWVAIVELRYSNSTDKSRSVSELAVQALREAGVQ